MKKLQIVKIAVLAIGCAALAFVPTQLKAADTIPANPNAAALFASIGGSFVLTPTGTQGVFDITADGIGQGSAIGNFTDHAQLQVTFLPPGGPVVAVGTGTATWTTSDGKSTVNASVTFVTTPDPAGNPFVINNTYQVTITGGTGAFASAAGSATESEVAKFKPDFSGGTWSITVKGHVVTPPSGS
jgi:hypothetical protein